MKVEQWPVSILTRGYLLTAIGRFLRTHRGGYRLLIDLIESVPADRTEAQFEEEQRQLHAAVEAGNRAALEAMRADLAAGLPVWDLRAMGLDPDSEGGAA